MGMAIFKINTLLTNEVEVTRERTIMGIQGVKNEGRWVGKPPYGYNSKYVTKDEKDKGILLINPEGDIVRTIFDFKKNSFTNSQIVDQLIDNSILTRTGKRNWASATISGILAMKCSIKDITMIWITQSKIILGRLYYEEYDSIGGLQNK